MIVCETVDVPESVILNQGSNLRWIIFSPCHDVLYLKLSCTNCFAHMCNTNYKKEIYSIQTSMNMAS